jgi:hypothetical protein
MSGRGTTLLVVLVVLAVVGCGACWMRCCAGGCVSVYWYEVASSRWCISTYIPMSVLEYRYLLAGLGCFRVGWIDIDFFRNLYGHQAQAQCWVQ